MLKDEYSINIVGRQFYQTENGTEPGEITLQTTGTYKQRGETRFIAYKEYDSDNPKLVYTSILKAEPGVVTMMRSGTSTRLVLEQGRRHLCCYDTGYGVMSVGVYTSELNAALDSTGGRLSIKYTLNIDSNLASKNEIEVEVKPINGHI